MNPELPECDNRRHNWKKAVLVERGIEMEINHGYFCAARFLMQHDSGADMIERVLRQRLDRRAQSCGVL